MTDWTDNELPENIMKSLEVDDLAVNYDISAGTVYSKNSATAWVNFDGTTTPPTIRDSFNVSDVVRTATGDFEIYFSDSISVNNCVAVGDAGNISNGSIMYCRISLDNEKLLVQTRNPDSTDGANSSENQIQIFGGK